MVESLPKFLFFSFPWNDQVIVPRISHLIMEDGNSVYVLTMGRRKMFSTKDKTSENLADGKLDDLNIYCTKNAE